jgi:FAD synthase
MIHTERAEVPDIKALISSGIASLSTERKFYGNAMSFRVHPSELQSWIDGELKKKWGTLAAARTYLICETGFDGVFLDPFDKEPPSQKKMKRTEQVPVHFRRQTICMRFLKR